MSERNTILAGLQTALENITTGNGFNNTVLEVERKFLYIDGVSSFPKLMILGGDEEFEDSLGNQTVSNPFNIRIIGYVKDKKEPEVALCDLIADVLKLINSSTYNSTYYKIMRPAKVETDEGMLTDFGEGFAMFILTVECVYSWSRSSP